MKIKRLFQVCVAASLQAASVSMASRPRDQLKAKDADMEQALLLCYITTKVLVKCRIPTELDTLRLYFFHQHSCSDHW